MSEQPKNDVPMIPKHQHQAEMMHLIRAIKSIAIVALSAFVAMLIMAYIFVSGYTSRTKDWLNTYNNLNGNHTVIEVDNEQKEP